MSVPGCSHLQGKPGSLLLGPPSVPHSLGVPWSQVVSERFLFQSEGFSPLPLNVLQEQLSYFSTGNHTAASWGYGKGGKGGRHLIPLKWASKMSYHTNLKGGRELSILLSLGLLQYSLYTRVGYTLICKQMSACKTFLLE